MTTDPTPDEVAGRRAAWYAGLRSGAYAQAREALRVDRPDGTPAYCCLGVAEDVRGVDWTELSDADRDELGATASHAVDDPVLEDWQYLIMTNACHRWYGLVSGNPYVASRTWSVVGWEVRQLSELNDDVHLSLAEIAEVLEAQPPGWTGDVNQVTADVACRRVASSGTTEEDS